jgi:hypothetical protein
MTEPAGFAQAVEIVGGFGIDQPEDIVAALLAARRETPCPEGCDHGTKPYPAMRTGMLAERGPCPNPDCHEGMVTTGTPLVEALAAAARLTKEPEDDPR